MNRRGFIARLAAGVAAITTASVFSSEDKQNLLYTLESQGIADPEEALWIPGEKEIFLPGEGELQIVAPTMPLFAPGRIIRPSSVIVTLGDGTKEFYNRNQPLTGAGSDPVQRIKGPDYDHWKHMHDKQRSGPQTSITETERWIEALNKRR